MSGWWDFGRRASDLATWLPATPAPIVDEARPLDTPAMAEIHASAFAHGWSEPEIEALLAQSGVAGLVARRASPLGTRRPVGFVLTRLAADEAEILTVAVARRWQGRGVGRDLVETALRRLYAARAATVFLEVASTNAAAVTLYNGRGFRVVGERRGYYAGTADAGHALVMRRDFR